MHEPHERKKQRNIQKNFQMFPPNYLQGLSKMDVKYQTWNFFFSKTINTLFHFLTRKIGNFNFHSPYSYFVFFSNVGYLSHYLTKPSTAAINSRGPPKKTHTTPLKYTANSVCHLLGSWTFFSVTLCFFKKKKKYHEVHTKKKELNRTLSLFLLICFCSFFFIYVCIFHCLYFALSCCDTVALFFLFPSLTILCIEYQVLHTWNSGANLCREEENLVFCFGALFNSTLNFTQSGWHILFSPDLHFRLAKRVSGQTHSLQLETATRTDVSLVAPA